MLSAGLPKSILQSYHEVNATNESSEPSGTKTPSEFRYSQKSWVSGLIIVDLMLRREKVGYQEEN